MTGRELSETTEEESLGSFVAACLRANGVDLVFGIPGTHNLEIYRGLARHGIRHVLTRHEQGATYAADGYARATGRAGVVIATSGPGATNCITGLANAYADSVPLLVISPGVPRGHERRDSGHLHEVKDQRAGMAGFVRDSIRAESREAIEEAIHGAFVAFAGRRPRSMHIEIPTDVLSLAAPAAPTVRWPAGQPEPSAADTARAVEALASARRPLIVAGGGAVDAGASLSALVEATGIPVVTTVRGKGALDERHPLAAGALAGGSSAFAPIADADVVLAIGTELRHAALADGAELLRVDIEQAQLSKHHRATVPLLGDADAVLRGLLAQPALGRVATDAGWQQHVREAARQWRATAVADWALLHSAVLSGAAEASAPDVILTGDSSRVSWLGTVRTAVLRGPRRFLTTDAFATLGFALPAAIGAKLARPDAAVIALVGDGALMFTVQELATASEQRLPLPIVVVDDHGYGEIRQNMADADMEPYAVDLTPPDYVQLAGAFHCGYANASTPDALRSAVATALQLDRPTIIHVRQADLDAAAWRATDLTTQTGEQRDAA